MNDVIQTDDWDDLEDLPSIQDGGGWVLKKLKPKHRQICALIAQGQKNITVASLVGVEPPYITVLLRQPLIQQEIARISEIADVRLQAMTHKTVDVIGDVLQNGKHGDQLKAARLQAEMTGRVGSRTINTQNQVPADERLERLAGRLIGLLATQRNIADGTQSSPSAEDTEIVRFFPRSNSSAEENGIIEGEAS